MLYFHVKMRQKSAWRPGFAPGSQIDRGNGKQITKGGGRRGKMLSMILHQQFLDSPLELRVQYGYKLRTFVLVPYKD